MGADEVVTLRALKAYRREVVDPAIAAHHGRSSASADGTREDHMCSHGTQIQRENTAAFSRAAAGVKPQGF